MRGRFTYSMSFSTLLATLTAEFDYWKPFRNPGVHAGFLFAAIPLVLIAFNLLRVEVWPRQNPMHILSYSKFFAALWPLGGHNRIT